MSYKNVQYCFFNSNIDVLIINLIYNTPYINIMNPNTEYKKFTQEIYQELVNADVLKTTCVQHNVKLKGRSGQEHQIDVYW